jgi:hypothetical protein
MTQLTQEERIKIAQEEYYKVPLEVIGTTAIIKIAELAVKANSTKTTLSTEATLNDKRYLIKAVVTQKEVKK